VKLALRIGGIAACFALVSAVCAVSSSPEDELKAAAVLGFLRYSQWSPASAGPITVGVFGRAEFSAALERTLDGKTIGNRPVKLVQLRQAADARGCQLVYVSAAKAAEVKRVLAQSAAPVLTVGESEHFLEYGGAIYLFLIDGHIGFEVDLQTLGRSGVSISPSMLRLGQIRGAGGGVTAR